MTSEDYLRFLFNQWSNGQVERVKKAKDYAFVHFYNRAAAEDAKRAVENQVSLIDTFSKRWSRQNKSLPKPDLCHNFFSLCVIQIIDGEKVEVEWSRPVDKIQYNTRKALTKLLSSPQPPPPMPMLQGSRLVLIRFYIRFFTQFSSTVILCWYYLQDVRWIDDASVRPVLQRWYERYIPAKKGSGWNNWFR